MSFFQNSKYLFARSIKDVGLDFQLKNVSFYFINLNLVDLFKTIHNLMLFMIRFEEMLTFAQYCLDL